MSEDWNNRKEGEDEAWRGSEDLEEEENEFAPIVDELVQHVPEGELSEDLQLELEELAVCIQIALNVSTIDIPALVKKLENDPKERGMVMHDVETLKNAIARNLIPTTLTNYAKLESNLKTLDGIVSKYLSSEEREEATEIIRGLAQEGLEEIE